MEDPILAEVHRVKDALAAKHGYDLHRIFKALQAAEKKSGAKLVTLPPRRLPAAQGAQVASRPSPKAQKALTKPKTAIKRAKKGRSAA